MAGFMSRSLITCTLGFLLLGTLVAAEITTTPVAPQPSSAKAEAPDKAQVDAQQQGREQQAKMLELIEAQKAKAKAEAEAAQSKYTYQSTKFIPVQNKKSHAKLFSFCLGPDQKLYALVNSSENDSYDMSIVDGVLRPTKKPKSALTQEVIVLDLDGQELQRWNVNFKPERIVAALDGTVYVGGSGKLAKFSAQGKLLHEAELPHMAVELKDETMVKESALEEHQEQIEMYKQHVEQFQTIIKTNEAAAAAAKENPVAAKTKKKPAVDGDGVEAMTAEEYYAQMPPDQLTTMLEQYEKQLNTMTEQSEAEVIDSFKRGLLQKNSIHALTLSGENLIYTTRQLRGYAYAVWKVNLDLEQPSKIMQGLGGCCGQCDVQCHDGKLYVADNTKHRVAVYDLTGKKLSQAGKKGRDGDGENFGGCCNPMNVAFSSTGQILTAESEGYVKCFSPDGEFQALLGRSLLAAGCKHVALDMTKDGKYIVFLDQPGSRLVRLEKMTVPRHLENKATAEAETKGKASE